MFSKCLLRQDVVRVFVSSLVLVFVRAILSWYNVPLNMTCLHCLQHSLFEHLFNLYYLYYLLQLVFSACVAAVKSRLVLHHCVVIFFGPQGSWSVHVCCLHLKMEFCSCAGGGPVVWHYSLLLMNSFEKTEAAVFSCRLCFLRPFPFPFVYITWYVSILGPNMFKFYP